MKPVSVLLVTLLFNTLFAQEQKPDDLLKNFARQYPIEKAYVHFDRGNYFAGDVIWFKAYLISEYLPDTISSVLHVELVDNSMKVIDRKSLPVFLGTSTGQFELSDSLASGMYLIRAYTPTMLNYDHAYIFQQQVRIHGQRKQNSDPSSNDKNAIRVEFFPEGGNLVTSLSNTIAFKASDKKGQPVNINGVIKNEKGETLLTISSYHDGMGSFEFTPMPGEKYYAEIENDVLFAKHNLPGHSEKGIAVSMIPHPQGNFFEIKQQKKYPEFRVAYMIGQIQHRVVFKQHFNQPGDEIQGVINTQNLMSGILQITFFNDRGMPLAERLCFVDNGEYHQPVQIVPDTVDFSQRGKSKLNIILSDTIKGNISVSITDPEYDILPSKENHIISHFLLRSDLNGYIHNPAFYFSAKNDSVKTAIDMVMMTNGWRRFKWNELKEKQTNSNRIADPAYITLSGLIMHRDSKKPFAEKKVLLWITGGNQSRSSYIIDTDNQGRFRLDSLVFYGSMKILVSDIRGKKSQYIDVKPDSNLLIQLYQLRFFDKGLLFVYNDKKTNDSSRWNMAYDEIMKAKGTMLEEVKVKAKRKTPLEEMNEKYTRGLFTNDGTKTIDMVNTDEIITQENIFDYLQSRVPGLTVLEPNYTNASIPDPMNPSDDPSSYRLFYRQGPTASSLGNIPVTLYLDEFETSASVIATIPANQIALVKLFSSFAAAPGGGSGGALAIYTKKGTDINYSSRAGIIQYEGFSVVKEFYAPDYRVEKATPAEPDRRITLHWRPSVFINHVNPRIPVSFFNNDRTKSFKVVVEGVTDDGKLIFAEKTFYSSQTKF